MKETQWRTKLITKFKQARPADFIWAMDAKFKAGFPDLYVIINGGKTINYELKVVKKSLCNFIELQKLFDPIQISVMHSIIKAGGIARGLVLQQTKQINHVWLVYFATNTAACFEEENFYKYWMTTSHSLAEAQES